MQISGLSKSDINYNVKFKAINLPKDFNKEIEISLNKIKSDPEAKKLFAGLTALAGAAIAGLMTAAGNDKNAKEFAEEITKDFQLDKSSPIFSSLSEIFDEGKGNIKQSENSKKTQKQAFDGSKAIDEVPERKLYLKVTSYFPNLDREYKNMLEKHITEPKNAENEFTLKNIESFFEYVADKDRLVSLKDYIKVLDTNADNLNNIAKNISSASKNNESVMYYMVLLKGKKLTKEDIKLWTEVDNLGCDEFMMCKHLDKQLLENLSSVKEKYNYEFKITDFNTKILPNAFAAHSFKMNFPEDIEVTRRLKIVKDIHEAIYGKICYDVSREYSSIHLEHDIQTEMIDNVFKDRRMDAVYSLVKYVSPKSLKQFNMSAQEVKFLSPEDKTYKLLKNICSSVLISLNFDNRKLKELCDVLNDQKLFGDFFETRHAKLRFITRIVLKDNPNPANLRESCKLKMDILKNELRDTTDKCNYMCYLHPKGTAPQFYLGLSDLGNYVKITLNSSGSIHTIYEDITKEAKLLENQEKEQ